MGAFPLTSDQASSPLSIGFPHRPQLGITILNYSGEGKATLRGPLIYLQSILWNYNDKHPGKLKRKFKGEKKILCSLNRLLQSENYYAAERERGNGNRFHTSSVCTTMTWCINSISSHVLIEMKKNLLKGICWRPVINYSNPSEVSIYRWTKSEFLLSSTIKEIKYSSQ